MRNFASFANFAISSTEMFNIEGGATPVFGDATVTLNEAIRLDENQLANEITFGAPKVTPTVTSAALPRITPTPVHTAPKVKKVSYAPTFNKCVCAKGR
jgi:hypothetical protein